MVVVQWVVMKMLPFDNKSELQVILDMPEGTPVENTAAVLDELAAALLAVPETTSVQIYAGTAAPINFNGLVRQYEQRAIARARRHPGAAAIEKRSAQTLEPRRSPWHCVRRSRQIATRHDGALTLAEVPPGPPVRAPIVAEVYAPTTALRRELAERVRTVFAETPGVVDIDTSLVAPSPRLVVEVDREKALQLGVSQDDVVESLASLSPAATRRICIAARNARRCRCVWSCRTRTKTTSMRRCCSNVRTSTGRLVPLRELVRVEHAQWDAPIWHKDLQPLEFVIGDAVGSADSPLYGRSSPSSARMSCRSS